MYNNRIEVKGNLTRDPVFKTVGEKNSNLAEMRIAVTERFGKDREETLFIDVDAWGSNADYAQNCGFSKGDKIIVEGRLRSRDWTDQNDCKRASFSISSVSLHKTVKPTGGSSDRRKPQAASPVLESQSVTGDIPF